MAIYLTADCHFNHKNIIVYEKESRPFNTVEEMNEALIAEWGKIVNGDPNEEGDTGDKQAEFYVLGDFFMGTMEEIKETYAKLREVIGSEIKITLIRGNHDTSKRIEFYRANGITIKDIEYLKFKGKFFILCHFPIATKEFVDMITQENSEVVVCYGHIHSQAPTGYSNGTYHVGVDTNKLKPISLNKIYEDVFEGE